MQEHFQRKNQRRREERIERADRRAEVSANNLTGDDDDNVPAVNGSANPFAELINVGDHSADSSAGSEAHERNMATEFEDINQVDGDDVLPKLATVKVTWSSDVEFFFFDLEMKMELLAIKSQWYKRICLANNLPPKVQAEVKSILKKTKAAAGATVYKDLKLKVLELFAKKEEDYYEEAAQLVLVSKPSTLAKELTERLCTCDTPLSCCASRTVAAMWRKQLPTQVRTAVAGMSLKDDFEGTTRHADQVYDAAKAGGASGGAFAAVKPAQARALEQDEDDNDDDVAAVGGNFRGNGRGRRRWQRRGGDRGGGRGQHRGGPQGRGAAGGHRGAQGGQGRGGQGGRHPHNPPENCCKNHLLWGRNAYYCTRPSDCPWATQCSPPLDN